MQTPQQDHAGMVAPPPFIYLGSLVLGLSMQRFLPLPFSRRKRRPLVGGLLAAAGLTLGFTAFRTLQQHQTTLSPMAPVSTIVTAGPFQLSRNPIYLSMTLLYSGIALLANALWPMLLLPIVLRLINRGVIDREEQYLERKFGEQYRAYKQRVRRWL